MLTRICISLIALCLFLSLSHNESTQSDRVASGMQDRSARESFRSSIAPSFYFRNIVRTSRPSLVPYELGECHLSHYCTRQNNPKSTPMSLRSVYACYVDKINKKIYTHHLPILLLTSTVAHRHTHIHTHTHTHGCERERCL